MSSNLFLLLRVSPRISTFDGMALCTPSIYSSVHDTTAWSIGLTLRLTIVCSAMMISAAVTSGSIERCGAEACEPRPLMRIVKLSSLAMMPPTLVWNVPSGISDALWMP